MCMGTNEYTKQLKYGRKERKNKGAKNFHGQKNNYEKINKHGKKNQQIRNACQQMNKKNWG